VLVSINFLQEVSVFFFHSEVCEPPLHAILLLVKSDEAVHKGGNSVVITDLLLQTFAKRSLVYWRLHVFNVVHYKVFFIGGFIIVTAVCTSKAFVNWAVVPQYSVKATSDKLFFTFFLC